MVKVGRMALWELIRVVALGVLIAVATPLSVAGREPDDRLAIDFEATRLDGTPLNDSILRDESSCWTSGLSGVDRASTRSQSSMVSPVISRPATLRSSV